MRKLLLSSVAIGAIGIAAGQPAQAASPVYNWTGCYIGGNVGGGWAHEHFGPDPFGGFHFLGGVASRSSFVGGGQIGCDYQNGMWVFGAQGLFDWASMSADTPFFSGKGFRARVPWFASATGRLGYLPQPGLLVFIRGGAAFVRDEFQYFRSGPSGNVAATADLTRTGGYIGGGFEWMFAPNWSVTVEYGYMGFGTKSVAFEPRPPTLIVSFSDNVRQNVQVVLVGLNYRFGTMSGR